jgi:transposase-like protein
VWQGKVAVMTGEEKEAQNWRDEIGERIDGLVKFSGKTNVEIAGLISVTKETVRQWRRGKNLA